MTYGGTFTRRQAVDLNVDTGVCTICYHKDRPGFGTKTSRQESKEEPDFNTIHEDDTPWRVGREED